MTKWNVINLGEVLSESNIPSENPDPNKRITVKLNVGGIEKRPVKEESKGATKYYIRKAGQFIYGKQNLHKGAFGIVPDELHGYESTIDLPSFDIDNSKLLPEWLMLILKKNDFYKSLESIASGSATKRIHPDSLFKVKIPLPSINEQKYILEEYQKIYSHGKEIDGIINNSKKYIIKLRESILQEAIQGKLVPQDHNDEPANVLLEKIKENKGRLIKEKKIKKEKPLPPIKESEIPYDLPKGWVWVRFAQVLNDVRYGTSQKCDYHIDGVPVLRIPNINNGKISFTDLKFTNLGKREAKELQLEKDDLLMIRSNGSTSIVGRVALVDEIANGYAYAGYLIRLRPPKNYVNSHFIAFTLNSPLVRQQIESPIRTTTGVKNINSIEISKLLIPLPPINEQRRIVEKVRLLMNLCNELEKKIEKSKKDSELLLQSFLKEAFKEE